MSSPRAIKVVARAAAGLLILMIGAFVLVSLWFWNEGRLERQAEMARFHLNRPRYEFLVREARQRQSSGDVSGPDYQVHLDRPFRARFFDAECMCVVVFDPDGLIGSLHDLPAGHARVFQVSEMINASPGSCWNLDASWYRCEVS